MASAPLPDDRALARIFEALEEEARNGRVAVESVRRARESVFARLAQQEPAREDPGAGLASRTTAAAASEAPASATRHALGEAAAEVLREARREAHAAESGPADAPLVLLIQGADPLGADVVTSLRPHFRVATASDGQAGLAQALTLEPDVIIADADVPRPGGEHITRELRRNPKFDTTPILLLTADCDEGLRAEWFKLGVHDCLAKPFALDELIARARALVAHRQRAERMLEHERELLARIIDTIPVMITIFDPAQRTFRFNRELRDVLGWTEADAADGDFMAKVYPDPEYRNQVAEFMTSLEPGWRDLDVTAKDGSTVLSTWANVRLANDVSVGIGVDIRERKAAEEALRENQKLLASTMENFPTAITFKDLRGRFIDVNPPVEKALGLPKQRILGNTDHDFFPRDWADEARRNDLEVIRTRQPRQLELLTPAPTGNIYHLDTSFPLIDANGEVYGVGHISHDITALKQAEEALRESEAQLRALNETLEERVQQRTRELHEANENLQAFANTAAHDLRSPLRTISGFSEILLEDYGSRLDDTARNFLQRIARAAEHTGRLLNDLLEYSRLAQAELKLETVNLAAIAREALGLLESTIDERKAQVVVDTPLPPVTGHPATMTVIVTNLVSNALKFTRPGLAPHVRIRAEEAGPRVRLWVEDNGIGIADADRPKLFGAFQRLHGKDVYPGTGLGLALVRRAAVRMGGSVGVESRLGEGSRFWVELPKA